MARNVSRTATELVIERWIAITDTGHTRLCVAYPNLRADEIAMEIRVTVPRALFRKPRLKASITVPTDHDATIEITPQIIDNVIEAVRRAVGFEVVVTKEDPQP